MAKRINEKKLKRLDRYYMIAKVFLMVTPFIAYLYLSLLAMMRSITLPEVLSSEPSVAVIFLIAMINPYIAYLLNIAQRKLKEGDIKFACINFVLLLLAQALTLNSLYFMIIAYLFYVTVKTYDKKNGWKTYTNVSGDTIIGSIGESLPLQAVNVELNGLEGYKLQYRTHLSNVGWSNWANQGSMSGVTSGNEQMEAIEFRLVQDLSITSVTLNKSSTTLNKGSTETLQATINPTNTTDDKTLGWSSSNTSVAKVDANGKITAVSNGTATITVKTSNGKTATCTVTVVEQTPSVNYQTHVQDIGWQTSKKDGQTAGTVNQSKRLEAIKISLSKNSSYTGEIQYQTHIQDIGWQDWKSNGALIRNSRSIKKIRSNQNQTNWIAVGMPSVSCMGKGVPFRAVAVVKDRWPAQSRVATHTPKDQATRCTSL